MLASTSAASSPAPAVAGCGISSSSVSSTSARYLTVADLQHPERHPSVPAQRAASTTWKAVAPSRKATLHLDDWVKRHPHLRAVAVAVGDATVALMLLWEVDHSKPFPCRTDGRT